MGVLASVSDLEEWLGTPSGASTTLLGSCIDRAEQRLADICGRGGTSPWVSGSRTEYLDGDLANGLLLTFTPVTAVSSVVIVTGADSSGTETSSAVSTTRLAVDGYPIGGTFSAMVGLLHFRTTGRDRILGFEWGEPVGYLSVDPGPAFSAGHYRVKVAYTGGVTAAAVPESLVQATLELAEGYFRRSGQNTRAVSEAFLRQSLDVEEDRVRQLVSPFVRVKF